MAPRVTSESIGRRIRTARAAAGLSQRELADRTGASPAKVSAIERGKVARIDVVELKRMADILRTTLAYLTLQTDRIGVDSSQHGPTPAASSPGEDASLPHSGYLWTLEGPGVQIAVHARTREILETTVRQIIAVPTLLEALEYAVHRLDQLWNQPGVPHTRHRLQKAIAEARGDGPQVTG